MRVPQPSASARSAAASFCFAAAMAPHQPLIETIFAEMKGRLKQDDSSVPQRDGDWIYWWAFRPGGQYRVWYRKPAAGGEEQVILDEPAEAEGKEYFRLQVLEVSPDGRLAAWAADASGAERFTLRIRDLATGADVETVSAVTSTVMRKRVRSGSVPRSARPSVLLADGRARRTPASTSAPSAASSR